MRNNLLMRFTAISALVIAITYGVIASMSIREDFNIDPLLRSESVQENIDEVGLNLIVDELDVDRGVMALTATPQLSGNQGISTSNGAFLKQSISFSFDVFSGPTLLDVPTGQFLGAQSLGLRLNGSPNNYPFDEYRSKFYATASSDFTEDGTTELIIRDKTEAIPGYSGTSRYLAFQDESTNIDLIKTDIAQGMGLIEWSFKRSTSTILAAFLLGGLMLIGAAVSSLMTISVLRGRRPPSINSLVWFAAFLFALFQVRNQLPGDPPNGIKFDLFIFYPVILLLIILIAINVELWSNRDDWDLENPNVAIGGKIKKPENYL